MSDTSYIAFDEKGMIPVPEDTRTWQQRMEAWVADIKHMFITVVCQHRKGGRVR